MTESAATPHRQHSHEYEHLLPLLDELAELDAGDPRRADLREQLVTGFLPVAENIARRFSGRGAAKDDLVQVATLGLINAIDRFDPGRGTDFLSYAVPTVMGEVRRHFRDSSWTMRVPRRLKELHQEVSAASGTLSQRLGRAPTPAEIAEYLGVSRDDVYQGLQVGHAYHPASLEESVTGDDEGMRLAETVGEEDAGIEGVENHESLQPLLSVLPQRERRILALRFFENLTQTQIAERVGLSQMHVSRLLSRSLARLREGITEDEG
ncbi:RNA polymerase, sigma 28 subunit, SigD/FliA/WhiG [Haloechinothrix alba]|uniref:RNA polymerase, sigma 28 subunit, SigD/FliA/WhiG n=1 Tax=Haloechinothrix alba TaxID=664784 RepID=A0A238ZKB0_9PSEU|nr:SigB/SigF/SigG family RNA polymerase sigma factor [Haloechinothrix alba]SNR83418.1 RNA polymerase, sigma 28 subunit, SigD/FliA/WhiG [Haloechinothrix alba]